MLWIFRRSLSVFLPVVCSLWIKFELGFRAFEVAGLEFAGLLGVGFYIDFACIGLDTFGVMVGTIGFRSLAVSFFSIRMARPFESEVCLSWDLVLGFCPEPKPMCDWHLS